MTDFNTNVKTKFDNIEATLDSIMGDLSAGTPVGDIVTLGSRLWNTLSMFDTLGETLKERLRSEAGPKPEKYTFLGHNGAEGSVTVTAPFQEVAKKTTVEGIKEAVGENAFNILFETQVKIKPRKDFKSLLKSVDDDTKQKALKFLVTKQNKARVSFK